MRHLILAAQSALLPRNHSDETRCRPSSLWWLQKLALTVILSWGLNSLPAHQSRAADHVVKIAAPFLAPAMAHPYQGLALATTLHLQPIFDALTVVDERGQVQPWLARSWSSDDSVVWTFELRDDVTFSNGEVFDAAAVVATLEHLQSPNGQTETVGSTLAAVVSAKAVAEFTVDVRLSQPDAMFPLKASMWRIPAPAHFKALGIEGFAADPVGTGPFTPITWTLNSVRMAAVADSWRAPKVQEIEIIQIPEQIGRRQAISSGAVDIAIGLGPSDAEELARKGGTLHSRPQSNMTFIAFALEVYPDSPIQDVRVRQALNYAVNRKRIAEVILDGYPDLVAQLAVPGAPGFEPTLEPYPYNPERAKELLAESGYENGFPLTMAGAALGSDDSTVYQQVAADLAAVNIDVSIQLAPVVQMTLMLFRAEMKGEIFTQPARVLDPLGDYRYRSCLGLTVPNKPFFCDQAILPLVNQARAATSRDVMSAALNQVLIHEYNNPPGIFLWEGLDFDGIAARVKTYEVSYDFIHFHTITLEEGNGI